MTDDHSLASGRARERLPPPAPPVDQLGPGGRVDQLDHCGPRDRIDQIDPANPTLLDRPNPAAHARAAGSTAADPAVTASDIRIGYVVGTAAAFSERYAEPPPPLSGRLARVAAKRVAYLGHALGAQIAIPADARDTIPASAADTLAEFGRGRFLLTSPIIELAAAIREGRCSVDPSTETVTVSSDHPIPQEGS